MVNQALSLLDELLAALAKIMPGELSSEQLDVLESKANSAVSAIRSLRNMSSPIHQVPIEVLALIFGKLIEMETPEGFLPDCGRVSTMEPAIQPPSRVCKKWREAALTFPALWSTIYRSAGPSVLLSLERSQDTLLKVYTNESLYPDPHRWNMYSPPVSPRPEGAPQIIAGSVRVLNTLVPQGHRIQHLHILDADADALSATSLMNTPLPRLESLTLSMNYRSQPATWSVMPIWQPDKVFDGIAPCLRQLTLQRFPCLIEQTFSGLTHLCLANQVTPQRFTLGRLLDLLRGSPQLEELALVDCGPDMDDLTHDKVALPNLRILAIGVWSSAMSISMFMEYLVILHPIHFYIWGAVWDTGSMLSGLFPLHATQGEYIQELRFTACPRDAPPYHVPVSGSLWRTDHQYAVVSTRDKLQIDGRIDPAEFLFDAPRMLNLSGVQELWLGTSYRVEPSLAEWRTFFFSLTSLLTLVISRRSSHGIISALTLPKDNPQGDLLCPDLQTLRIYNDRLLSVLRLSIFAEQRDRRNRRLKLVDVISDGRTKRDGYDDGYGPGGYQSPTPWPPVTNPDGSAILVPPWPEAVVADLMHLEEYVDKVDCTRVVTDPEWDVVPEWPPKAFTWLNRPPAPSPWPH